MRKEVELCSKNVVKLKYDIEICGNRTKWYLPFLVLVIYE